MFSFLLSLLVALVVTVERLEKPKVPGHLKRTRTKVTCPEKYEEGGFALTPANLGLSRVNHTEDVKVVSPGEATANFANAYYDVEEEKLKLYDETPGEVADEGIVTGLVLEVIAYGS